MPDKYYYPKPGSYRFLMDNPPPNPGPSTKFATSNGVGIQVTAVGSDDDRPRQRVRTISFIWIPLISYSIVVVCQS